MISRAKGPSRSRALSEARVTKGSIETERRQRAEERLGYTFADPALLRRALTHSSAREVAGACNERLEFLGDAVLAQSVARHLFTRYPRWNEGELSRVQGAVVSTAPLARAVHHLKLESLIIVGKGLASSALSPALLAGVFEALVAAIFIDGGLAPAERFCLTCLDSEIEAVAEHNARRNWKTILQQLSQRELTTTPSYFVVSEEGPDHEKRFTAGVRLGAHEGLRGGGGSKKEAEQDAARKTLGLLLGEAVEVVQEGAIPPLSQSVADKLPAPKDGG